MNRPYFHRLPGLVIIFKDFPVLQNATIKFQDPYEPCLHTNQGRKRKFGVKILVFFLVPVLFLVLFLFFFYQAIVIKLSFSGGTMLATIHFIQIKEISFPQE